MEPVGTGHRARDTISHPSPRSSPPAKKIHPAYLSP